MTCSAISVKDLNKVYVNGFQALNNINLDIKKGEIFALLGPNGAGKTTLIGSICGTVQPTSGQIKVFDYDYVKDYREARSQIGLVPQELFTDHFETVWNTVSYSRALFGKPSNPKFLRDIIERLSLFDKKDQQVRTLSGGMKRRLMIAKALAHEPKILFLDEPSAGVDVELRKSMWEQIEDLRSLGVTIFLTTHYIEEAEKMADRIAVINHGKIILTETKDQLMKRMGNKQVKVDLEQPLETLPANLLQHKANISIVDSSIIFNYPASDDNYNVFSFLEDLKTNGIKPKDIHVNQRSLEDIFIELVENK